MTDEQNPEMSDLTLSTVSAFTEDQPREIFAARDQLSSIGGAGPQQADVPICESGDPEERSLGDSRQVAAGATRRLRPTGPAPAHGGRVHGAGDYVQASRRRLDMIAAVEDALRDVDVLLCASAMDPPTAEVLAEVAEQTRLADELGYAITWFAEHHFSNYCLCASPLMMVAHCASITKKIRLGTAVVVLPLYNPAWLAAEIATADALSNGRLMSEPRHHASRRVA